MGTIRGTNRGTVFAEFTESEGRISGVVNITDTVHGIGMYTVTDSEMNPDYIRLVLTPNQLTRLVGHGIVTVLARFVSKTEFVGDWRSSIGTAGTLSVTKVPTEPQREIASSNKRGVTVQNRKTVFISYSHHDRIWLMRLRVHLKPLERDCALDIWDDRKIKAGSKWKDEIERAIQSARVGVLIVSANFLASDFIANNELPPLLDAAQKDGAVIMSLIVSPSRFTTTKSLSQFQAVNDPSRPLINLPKGKQEEILVRVSDEIEAVFRSR